MEILQNMAEKVDKNDFDILRKRMTATQKELKAIKNCLRLVVKAATSD